MVDKKRKLPTKEKSLWDQMILEVLPIKKTNKKLSRFDNQLNQIKLNQSINNRQWIENENNALTQKDNHLTNKTKFNLSNHTEIKDYPLVGAFSFIQFCSQNVSIKQFRQLKKGNFPIKTTIDLHGLNINESREIIEQYLSQYHSCCLLIIHGKGYHSDQGKSQLKSWINSYLRKNNKVKAFCSAQAIDGGTGAVYVLIK